MNDATIDELCQRIYKNHRKALDLIYDRAGSPSAGLLIEVESVIQQDQRWHIFHRRSNVIDFVPTSWVDWLPPWASRRNPQSWIYIHFWLHKQKLSWVLEMTPMKEPEKRIKLAGKLRDIVPNYNFKRSGGREIKNNYSTLSGTKTFFKWQEDNEPEEDRIRQAVKKELDELYPKLQNLEVELKPLVKEFETTH